MTRFSDGALRALVPYVPGEQPQDARGWIKLNTNESPFPPSPQVIAALGAGEAEKLRLYSDPACGDFLAALAAPFEVAINPSRFELAGKSGQRIFVGDRVRVEGIDWRARRGASPARR